MATIMKRIFINTFLVIITLFLTSCSRGPEQETLQQDLQSRIDQRFGKGLLELTNFRRYGSQPLSSNDGRDQIAIYYRAELRLLKNHRFSDWSDKNISALHQVLGSAIKGVEGVVAKGNQAGDSLVAYGLSVYADDNENWLSVPFKKGIEADEIISEKVAEVDAENQLGQNSQAIWQRDIAAQLNHLSETSTDFNSVDQTNLRAELQAVLTKAKLKQLRKTSQTTLLSGSSKGNYHDLAQGISQVVSQKNKSFNPIPSSGAIENINLIEEELATFALTQSDLAAASFNGTNIFKNKKNSNLRAIAALYPEAVQIVIPNNSSIKRIADLNAKRVNLGASGTGTQANAKQILDIAGVSYENFSTMDFASSVRELIAGNMDAIFITGALPSRYLQGVEEQVTLLAIDQNIIDELVSQHGYVNYQIQPQVYPSLKKSVSSVAVTALLVANQQVSAPQVTELLESLFNSSVELSNFGKIGASIDRERALDGIAIPLHPAASKFFKEN